jgi:hypothetical protein
MPQEHQRTARIEEAHLIRLSAGSVSMMGIVSVLAERLVDGELADPQPAARELLGAVELGRTAGRHPLREGSKESPRAPTSASATSESRSTPS